MRKIELISVIIICVITIVGCSTELARPVDTEEDAVSIAKSNQEVIKHISKYQGMEEKVSMISLSSPVNDLKQYGFSAECSIRKGDFYVVSFSNSCLSVTVLVSKKDGKIDCITEREIFFPKRCGGTSPSQHLHCNDFEIKENSLEFYIINDDKNLWTSATFKSDNCKGEVSLENIETKDLLPSGTKLILTDCDIPPRGSCERSISKIFIDVINNNGETYSEEMEIIDLIR